MLIANPLNNETATVATVVIDSLISPMCNEISPLLGPFPLFVN